jgi:hypothetical protein
LFGAAAADGGGSVSVASGAARFLTSSLVRGSAARAWEAKEAGV